MEPTHRWEVSGEVPVGQRRLRPAAPIYARLCNILCAPPKAKPLGLRDHPVMNHPELGIERSHSVITHPELWLVDDGKDVEGVSNKGRGHTFQW